MPLFDFMFETDEKKPRKNLKKKGVQTKEKEVKKIEESREFKPKPEKIVPPPVQQKSQNGEVDEAIKKQLMDVLLENNLEGYDYLEFRKSLNDMRSIIPSEPDRYKATYTAVQSVISVDELIRATEFYITKLSDKKEEFDQTVASMVEQNVTAKETEADSIEGQITQKQEEITRLNQEIAELQQSKMSLQNDVISEKAKIERVNLNFITTYNDMVQSIQQDKTKISTYLSKPEPVIEKEKES